MSKFEVLVKTIDVFPHPDPETTALEVGRIDDYQVVVKKGQFKTGDLVVYIPEAAIVPLAILKEMGLEGRLAGSGKDRVKAVKLRGILSQGLCYPMTPMPPLGTDVAGVLGIKKYEPEIPVALAGEVGSSDIGIKFDLENVKKYPRLFSEGEVVVMTEKIHGTWCGVCLVPEAMRKAEMLDGRFIVISKGLAGQNLFFKDNERNKNNTYLSVVRKAALHTKLERIAEKLGASKDSPVWLLGEVFGKGVQDLTYGLGQTEFRAFAIVVGRSYVSFDRFLELLQEECVETVPVLYKGPYTKAALDEATNGKTVAGGGAHVKEGCVIIPLEEGECEIGRKALKSVSEAYLLRKGGTEYT